MQNPRELISGNKKRLPSIDGRRSLDSCAMPRPRHAFFVNALHQPFDDTCLPGNAAHGPDAAPGLP